MVCRRLSMEVDNSTMSELLCLRLVRLIDLVWIILLTRCLLFVWFLQNNACIGRSKDFASSVLASWWIDIFMSDLPYQCGLWGHGIRVRNFDWVTSSSWAISIQEVSQGKERWKLINLCGFKKVCFCCEFESTDFIRECSGVELREKLIHKVISTS